MHKILLTGGSGLLGTELKKYVACYSPTHKELDITKIEAVPADIEMVIHCAAYTSVLEAETDKFDCFDINVIGTYNLIKACEGIPFVYISSEYAGPDNNVYGQSKWIGELMVSILCKDYLILRTLFKPNPYPWKYAFTDQVTYGDYVDIIAPLIAGAINNWNRHGKKLLHIGTEKKTMFELAQRTRPDVLPNTTEDIKGVVIPKNHE